MSTYYVMGRSSLALPLGAVSYTHLDVSKRQAIKVFAENLHHLLMQPPLTGHVVLGWAPGYRNGCKLAVLDATGRVLDTAVVYPTQPFNKIADVYKRQSRCRSFHSGYRLCQ